MNVLRAEVLAQHQTIAEKFGNQPEEVVTIARNRQRPMRAERDLQELLSRAIVTARDRNIERKAVVDERAILADALRHGMGTLRTAAVRAEFDTSVQAGELIEVHQRPGKAGRAFTTPEMKQVETEVVLHMGRGRDQHEELAPRGIQEAAIRACPHLSASQQAAVRDILGCRDQVLGLEGAAGTGKTTALKAVCNAAKQAGFEVTGLAPTSRAALNLEDAGIGTKTMARHLIATAPDAQATKQLYVVDESSMASTRQMHDFLKTIRVEDRVLFVGDTRQHEAVDAGRPYAQLQEAGMYSARLTEIIRQKDPDLKAAVEQLARGDAESAIENLRRQGRVHEFIGREERIQAIAHAYVVQPANTLVVSPDNNSRMEISKKIHEEMKGIGKVAETDQIITVLAPRQDMTNEDRRWAHNYAVGDVLRYTKSSKTINVAAREIVAIDEVSNRITVERRNGEQITYDPRRVQGVTAFREAERGFAEGDRVQFTTAFHPQRIANRELGTIEQLDAAGNVRLQMDSGRRVAFNLQRHPHLDYGYAVTSHSSQGETTDRVLIHVDSEHAHKGLINNRMAYVAVSRARHDAPIFTNDAESLGRELSKDVSHSAALEPAELQHAIKASHQVSQTQAVGFAL